MLNVRPARRRLDRDGRARRRPRSASSAERSPAGGGGGRRRRRAPPAARQRLAGPLATAFAHTYWWALALTAVAFVPALVMWREQRRTRARAEFGPASADAVQRDHADASRPRVPAAGVG